MDCAEAEVMERASAKMASWFRIVEELEFGIGTETRVFLVQELGGIKWEEVGIRSQELICTYVATTANWQAAEKGLCHTLLSQKA